jgi:tRNA threonylcarbamoyladenosine biosynthesis protein TsaE
VQTILDFSREPLTESSMPPQTLSSHPLFLPDETATFTLGQRLATGLQSLAFSGKYTSTSQQDTTSSFFPGLRIHLSGPLGAGKTALVRAILRGLGYEGRVRSPTYTLLEPYTLAMRKGMLTVYHFDLYRLSHPLEWEEMGFRDHLHSGALCLIEWPEQAEPVLAPPDCLFTLKIDEAHSMQTIDDTPALQDATPSPHPSSIASPGRSIIFEAFSEVGQQYLDLCT